MAARAMDTLCALSLKKTVAVVSDEDVAALARARGMETIVNDAPEQGLSRSIVLGVQAAQECGGVLLMAADQPGLTEGSLRALLGAFDGEDSLCCLSDETHSGNPAVFGRAYFGELCALQGDRGAKRVLCAHEDRLHVVPCLNAHELADADDPQALAAFCAHLSGINGGCC